MRPRGRNVLWASGRDIPYQPDPSQKAATLSSEPILRPSAADLTGCAACGAVLDREQRYCLECGERRPAMSEFLRGGSPAAGIAAAASPPTRPPVARTPNEPAGRPNQTLSVIAGIGVLLLAMGVGVLIGRSASSGTKAAPAQVITVAGAPSSGAASAATSEEAFTDDWPSGTRGYTVQLQALPETTTPAAVSQAKTSATAKGAGAVGALKEADFSSLTGGGYLIYSGVYHKRAEAQRALGSLKSKFPGAKVVEVSKGGSGAASSSGAGSSLSHPAPPSVLEGPSHLKGKSYEEKSKNLPDVVETG